LELFFIYDCLVKQDFKEKHMKKKLTSIILATLLLTFGYSFGISTFNTFMQEVWTKSPDLKVKKITLKINEITIKEKQGLYDLNLSLQGASQKDVGVYNSQLGTSIDNDTKSVKVGLTQKIGTGGDLSASFQNTRKDSGSTTYYSKMGFGYSQPLLKDFGQYRVIKDQ